jgi:hypothetical protein
MPQILAQFDDTLRKSLQTGMSWTFRNFFERGPGAVLRAACIVFLLSCAPAHLVVAAQYRSVSADSVKAAFLFNFGSYVEWPADAMDADDLVIGVVGADSIARELRRLLPGRTVENRRVHARALRPSDSLDDIHILYIGRATEKETTELIERAAQGSVLVITDTPEGMKPGSMINFVIENRRVRFEISPSAAERARLKLSSRLLSVAIRVHSNSVPFGYVGQRGLAQLNLR